MYANVKKTPTVLRNYQKDDDVEFPYRANCMHESGCGYVKQTTSTAPAAAATTTTTAPAQATTSTTFPSSTSPSPSAAAASKRLSVVEQRLRVAETNRFKLQI